jgi:hypothetical protein
MKKITWNKARVFVFTLMITLIFTVSLAFGASINKKEVMVYTGKSTVLSLQGTTIKSVSSSNSKIATISKKGVVKGIKAGSCYVYMKGKNNVVYKCKVTVKNPYINKVVTAIYAGKSTTLKLYGTTIKSVSSSNKKVATVTTKGVVKGIKAGTCYVYLKGTNNVVYKCKVTVKNPYISKTTSSIYVGKTTTLKLYGTTIKSVSTSNNKVATVTIKGVVKGINEGTCYIYIKGNNNVTYKCLLKVLELKT